MASATPLHLSLPNRGIADHGRNGLDGIAQQRKELIEREVDAAATTNEVTGSEVEEGITPDEEQDAKVPGAAIHPWIATMHEDASSFKDRAVNQSTGRMGAEYVKLRQEFNGGYIVLSVAMAFVGSMCTLELLLRR